MPQSAVLLGKTAYCALPGIMAYQHIAKIAQQIMDPPQRLQDLYDWFRRDSVCTALMPESTLSTYTV